MNQPQFWAIMREWKLCEKMAQLDPKRFAESQPKKHTNWKEKGSSEARQRPQAKQKEEKKAAALLLREELGERGQVLVAELKAKDPSAHLPESTFLLDGFKREYSHEDMLSVVLLHWGAL